MAIRRYTLALSRFSRPGRLPAPMEPYNLLDRLACVGVLVIDDWAMTPLTEPERREFWEIREDRDQVRSTIVASQFPVSRWHQQIGDPTLADGILDRLVTMPTASRCVRIPCVRIAGSRTQSEHRGQEDCFAIPEIQRADDQDAAWSWNAVSATRSGATIIG
jgi:hypothetical protein